MFLMNSLIENLLNTILIISLLPLVLIPVDCVRISPPFISNRHPPLPRIWLSEYSEDDSFSRVPAPIEFQTMAQFENEFITKNGTDFVVRDGVSNVIFACQAKHPILWELPNLSSQITTQQQYLITSSTSRVSEFPPDADHPIDKHFQSFLFLSTSGERFFSVTFKCKAANPKVKSTLQESSLHVYYEGYDVLEKEGETISVSLPVNMEDDDHSKMKSRVALPCRPALPDIPITLEKQTPDGNWTQVVSRYLSFDPRLGFTLTKFRWSKKIMGLYRCSVNGSDEGRDSNAFVLVNVTASGDVEQGSSKFEPHLVAKGDATVELKGLSSEKVICCSGVSGDIPTMFVHSCEGHLQCEIMKALRIKDSTPELYLAQGGGGVNGNCSQGIMYQSPSLPQCLGENIDFAGEFVQILRRGVAQLANRSAYLKEMTVEDEYSQKVLTVFEDAAKANKAAVEEKMLILVGHDETLDMVQRENRFLSSPFYGFDQKPFHSNGESAEMESILEYDRNYYYENEPLRVMCFGLRYFYNEGGYLRVNWKNGSKTVLDKGVTDLNRFVYFYEDAVLNYYNFRYTFGNEIQASLEMDSVDCFNPVWNSDKWDKLTYKISTRVSISPEIGTDEEVVYFQINDVGRELRWEVEGTPRPEVNVMKDGKHLSSEFVSNLDEFNNGNGSKVINVKFGTVTYELQGSYNCIAKNVKGENIKTIKVIITDKESTFAIPVVLTCISVFSTILLTIGIKYKLQLGKMWRLRGHRL